MQMVGICVCFAYADARHMDMLHLCWFLTFPAQIRKKAVPDLLQPRQRSGQATQYVAVFSAESDAICCVPPLPRDRPLTTLKGRFAYSLAVIHYRKLR